MRLFSRKLPLRASDWGIAALGSLLVLLAIGGASGSLAPVVNWAKNITAWHGLIGFGVGVIFLAFSRPASRRIRSKRPAREGQPIRAINWWWLVFLALVVVVVVTSAALRWLLVEAQGSQDVSRARLDAVRTSLGIGAAITAVTALLFTARRQWLSERAQWHTEEDATEKRVTELYAKSVEQLGSEKAPVRLGGLHALERLAQNNPSHRQTVVDVICSYLRMPFPFDAVKKPSSSLDLTSRASDDSQDRLSLLAVLSRSDIDAGMQEELQVRLVAHDILVRHTRVVDEGGAPSLLYWPGISFRLAGATLFDTDLRNCTVDNADYSFATFVGKIRFDNFTVLKFSNFRFASFHGPAMFLDASFGDVSNFRSAVFQMSVNFDGVQFEGGVKFDQARFKGPTHLGRVCFGGRITEFRSAQFEKDVSFAGSRFRSRVTFHAARFKGAAKISDSEFEGDVTFEKAAFRGCSFYFSRFGADLILRDARFEKHLILAEVGVKGLADLSRLTVGGRLDMHRMRVGGSVSSQDAIFRGEIVATSVVMSGGVKFTGSEFAENAVFNSATFGQNADFSRCTFGGPVSFADVDKGTTFCFDDVVLGETGSTRCPVVRIWPPEVEVEGSGSESGGSGG